MSSSGLAPEVGRGALAVIFTSLRTAGDDGYRAAAMSAPSGPGPGRDDPAHLAWSFRLGLDSPRADSRR